MKMKYKILKDIKQQLKNISYHKEVGFLCDISLIKEVQIFMAVAFL